LGNVGNWRRADGDREAAVASYLNAVEISEKLVKLQATRARWKIDLAGLHMTIGHNLLALNDVTAARDHAAKSRALVNETTPPPPENAETHKSLSEGLQKLEKQLRELPPAKSDN
jgi:hypothetical protein